MFFEWDKEKNIINKKKHGISFEEAIEIFDDPNVLEKFDERHSTYTEERFLYIGLTKKYLVVSVFTTDRNGRIRIISARHATNNERRQYIEELRRNN